MTKPRYPSEARSPHTAGTAIAFAAPSAALAALAWAYWPTATQLAAELYASDDYSVCLLVPFVALYMVWHDREALRKCHLKPSWWLGIGLILIAQVGRLFGLLFLFESAERYALVLTVVGLVLFIAGRQVLRQLLWVLLFLFLVVPLPGRIHNMVSSPLQTQSTIGAVFLLEMLGENVERAGTVIRINGVPVSVAEACSGLRMLTAFIVVAATLAYLVNRPRWQKAVLLVSSIPVAITCNLIRLVITAGLFGAGYSKAAEAFFHDFAGIMMMPLAILILVGELWLMNRLVISDEPPRASASRIRAVTDHP